MRIQGSSSSQRWFRRNPVLKCYKEIVLQSNTFGNSLWRFARHENILKALRNPAVKDLSKPVFPRGVWLWNSFIKEPLIAFHKTSVLPG